MIVFAVKSLAGQCVLGATRLGSPVRAIFV